MKHFKRFFALFTLFASIFIFNSCSDINEDSSVSFEISPSSFKNARDLILSSDDQGESVLYVAALLRGDYEQSRILTLSWMDIELGGKKSVEFDSIPANSNIYLDVNVFTSNGYWRYRGTSSSFTTKAGKNSVTINMKMLNSDAEGTELTLYNCYCYSLPICDVSGMGTLFLDEDGFFEIIISSSTISKGKWHGTADRGGTLYLTEYIYDTISEPEDEYAQIVNPDKTIVITSLSEFAVPISSEDGSYSFTLKNGAYFSGQIVN